MTTQFSTPKNLAKILALVLVFWLGWQWSTHYVNWSPYDLSEYIAKNNLRVEECNKLVVFNPPGPMPDEQIRTCIYLVAELTKDPSACELLMPSSYGWDCLGGAMDFEPCVFLADGEKTVKGQGIVTTYDQCISGPTSTKNHVCCAMARITFQDSNTENCNVFKKSDTLSDQCHHEKAINSNNLTECDLMKNLRNKTACEVGVRALLTK